MVKWPSFRSNPAPRTHFYTPTSRTGGCHVMRSICSYHCSGPVAGLGLASTALGKLRGLMHVVGSNARCAQNFRCAYHRWPQCCAGQLRLDHAYGTYSSSQGHRYEVYMAGVKEGSTRCPGWPGLSWAFPGSFVAQSTTVWNPTMLMADFSCKRIGGSTLASI